MEETKMEQYRAGKMVKFICSNCDYPLNDIFYVPDLICLICGEIEMTPVSVPHTHRVDDVEAENIGISSVLVIKESHIAIHTWPYYQAARIVIDSCKDFSDQTILTFLQEKLKTQNINVIQEESHS